MDRIQVGIKFPTREIGPDHKLFRDWAQSAEQCGYDYICVIDHVLGADPSAHPEWGNQFPARESRAPYTWRDQFHEAMVLMGFFAGITSLSLSTAVLVLPQRQTALVAKQAAEIDFLSGGRLRLGVASGWNPVEYEALGQHFRTRGRRLDEQINLLRALWTNDLVNARGEFDAIDGAGITPQPIQRPIPLWVGGYADAALRRAACLSDGWIGGSDPERVLRSMMVIRQAAEAAGRDPTTIGLEVLANTGYGHRVEDLAKRFEAWRTIGATHITVDTMGADLQGARHVEAAAAAARAVGLTS
jgi:probable F420-dependent oxidoreductase